MGGYIADASPSGRPARRSDERNGRGRARQGYRETAVALDADGATIAVPHGVGAGIHTLDSGHDKAYTSTPFSWNVGRHSTSDFYPKQHKTTFDG